MRYRREIDGLRAIAVLPVMLFHAGFSVFQGGYVGVDIFFVISGYLITTILLEEVSSGNFTFARFYERRVRRIAPALFVVILACLPFAYLWMTPSQLGDFSESIVTVALALSNIYFLSQVDYFAPAAELQPLLHTWSLAVEEQYYLFFPLVLLIGHRFLWRKPIYLVGALTLLSFAFSEWGWRVDAERSFFFTLSRFWEIGVGSLAAFFPVSRSKAMGNVAGSVGIALILGSILFFDAQVPWPSAYALVPIIGTVLILLFATRETWAGRLLSTPALVRIGLVSYSAYLWHQPIFAFARIRSLEEPGQALMALLIVLTLLLAWGTWLFVEQPFRRKRPAIFAVPRRLFAAFGVVSLSLIALGLVGRAADGFPGRFDARLAMYLGARKDGVDSDCHFDERSAFAGRLAQDCLHTAGTASPSVMLIGDSHSEAISGELGEALRLQGLSYFSVSFSGCPSIPGLRRFDRDPKKRCPAFSEEAYDMAASEGVSTVVLTSRMPWYVDGLAFDNGEGGKETEHYAWLDVASMETRDGDNERRRSRLLNELEVQIRLLASRFNVVLVYPIPEAGWDVPDRALKTVMFNDADGVVSTSYARYLERTQLVHALYDRLVDQLPNVSAARVYKDLCSEATGRCKNADAGGVYYRDDDHLSNAGARLVVPTVMEAISASLVHRGERNADE